MAITTLRDLLLDLNRVRYSSLDFHTHFDDMLARMEVKFAEDFNDLQSSTHAIMLMELSCIALDTLSFYIDRRATESFLETARTRKAVNRLARQLGYKPKGAVPAAADITVSLTQSKGFPVTIPSGFQFKTEENIIYETSQSVTFATGDDINDTQIIPCYQGITFSETFTSNGLPNQVFELTQTEEDEYVSFGSVTVKVNGTTFVENEFLTYEQSDQYEVSYIDEPVSIRFGDGISGNIPPKGSVIQVSYIVTKGRDGLVEQNSINTVVSPLVVFFTQIPLTITNLESSSGASDIETIEEVKAAAGKLFNTRNVAITKQDYETLASFFADPLFGKVAVATAISSKSSTTDVNLKNIMIELRSIFDEIQPDIDSIIADIKNDISTALDETGTITLAATSINSNLATASTSIENIITLERTNKGVENEIEVDANTISTNISGIYSLIDALPVGVTDQLTVNTKSSYLATLNIINATANDIIALSSILSTNLTTNLTTLATVQELLSSITTNMTIIGTSVAAIENTLGESSPTETQVFEKLTSISTLVVNVDDEAEVQFLAIEEHVDAILGSDCEANLVSVPILALNTDGFYTAPSIGLIKSLQTFLEERKEVTQVVKVTSGAYSLVPCVLTVKIGIFAGFSQNTIQGTAKLLLETFLKKKKFGNSLYVSDMICLIKDIPGVSFVNLKIDGHLDSTNTLKIDKLDIDGNLIISPTEVITKGEINYTVTTI